MITMVDKNSILIRFYNDGETKSSIASDLKICRKTVRKYIREHESLSESGELEGDLEKGLATKPRYKSGGRFKRKLTKEISEEITNCLIRNKEKRNQGKHKQLMKKIDILEYLLSKGYEIGYTTVCNFVRAYENTTKEAFIKQVYMPGESCEFDWGEVKIEIDGVDQKYNLATFTSCYSNKRYGKLFAKQDTLAFEQSHIDFFEDTNGVYHEMIYDNMRVAVARFVGNSEERATESLLSLSNYYKFKFRFCNVRKGNEKGHVERSVEYIRRKAFCLKDKFSSLDQANEHLAKVCINLNNKGQKLKHNKSAATLFTQEEPHLYKVELPYKSFKEQYCKVNKYATIILYCNHYSVPDYLVGKLVLVRVFAEKLDIYLNEEKACSHPRSYSIHNWIIDINHYLRTLRYKPGALKNSLAFSQLSGMMKNIYNQYFKDQTKSFIELLQVCKDKSIAIIEIEKAIMYLQKVSPKSIGKDTILVVLDTQKEKHQSPVIKVEDNEIEKYAKASLTQISLLVN